jgi:hypothetical protein
LLGSKSIGREVIVLVDGARIGELEFAKVVQTSTHGGWGIWLERVCVRKFDHGLSVEEALKEKEIRQKVIEEGRWIAKYADKAWKFNINANGVSFDREVENNTDVAQQDDML